jgi:hypothetical protein
MGRMNGGPINLASARLRRASLRFATLSGADLAAADLSGADLTDARLDGANLTNADLSHAVLNGTDLAGAKLLGTNLCGTNLAEARNLTAAQLAECVGDAATDLPAHLKRPRSWTASEADPERPAANGEFLPRSEVATRGKGGAMSWLVGSADAAGAVKLK